MDTFTLHLYRFSHGQLLIVLSEFEIAKAFHQFSINYCSYLQAFIKKQQEEIYLLNALGTMLMVILC